ncbi:MAG: DUF2214 family protein [Bacteroidia bacterium]
MTIAILVKYFHYISIFILVASVFCEFVLVKKALSRSEILRLSKIDMLYGLSSLAVVGFGFLLWLGVGKPADFYSENPIFGVKVTLAILLGLFSIYPTVYFMKNRKGESNEVIETPKLVFYSIYAEFSLLIIIPFLATLMANGIGL